MIRWDESELFGIVGSDFPKLGTWRILSQFDGSLLAIFHMKIVNSPLPREAGLMDAWAVLGTIKPQNHVSVSGFVI